MILIGGPYVSDFLLDTLIRNNFSVVATQEAKELITNESIKWIDEEDAIATINANPETIVYTNSENTLSWVEKNLKSSNLHQYITSFKDKFKFRELTKNLFPGFEFKQVSLEEIQELSSESLSYPFVIKPSIGFFSIGVHIINTPEDWENAKKELTPEKLKSIFPDSVLNTSLFIIESLIVGEEYAVDHYYDGNGKAQILNIMHHTFSSGVDTSDRVYSTSKEIIERHLPQLEELFNKIGRELKLKNFPAHAEVRIDQNGNIIPIEVNPMRFGGWCTTGEVLGVSIGYNTYEHFFAKRKPNWDIIFKGKEDKLFSMVVLDNNSGIAAENIKSFDYSKLAREFEHTILVRKFDIHEYPTFGFLFLETSKNNQSELDRILTSNLREYIY